MLVSGCFLLRVSFIKLLRINTFAPHKSVNAPASYSSTQAETCTEICNETSKVMLDGLILDGIQALFS